MNGNEAHLDRGVQPKRPTGLELVRDSRGYRTKIWWDDAGAWMCKEGYVLPTPVQHEDGTWGHDGVWRIWPRMTSVTKGLQAGNLDGWKKQCVQHGDAADPSLVMTSRFVQVMRRVVTVHGEAFYSTPVNNVAAHREIWRDAMRELEEAGQLLPAQLGDWNTVEALLAEADELGGANHGWRSGNEIHAASEMIDHGRSVEETVVAYPQWERQIRGYVKAKQVWGTIPVPELIEAVLINPAIGAAGRVDRISYRPAYDDHIVEDVKSGKKPGPALAEWANQFAGYAYAPVRFDYWANDGEGACIPLPANLNKDEANTIHLPYDATQNGATLIPVDIRKAYEETLDYTVQGVAMKTEAYAKTFLVGEPTYVPYEDERETVAEEPVKTARKCGNCSEPGHTSRTCTVVKPAAPKTRFANAAEEVPEVDKQVIAAAEAVVADVTLADRIEEAQTEAAVLAICRQAKESGVPGEEWKEVGKAKLRALRS